MGHTIGDASIVGALAAAFVAWLYFRHAERQHRLEIAHKERLAAIEKGIPLPEIPLDPPRVRKPPDPRAPLIHGLVWSALGGGAMMALRLFPSAPWLWPLPLPILLLGLGLMLYYALAPERSN